MAVTFQQLNQLYLAYFGRPADFAGVQYYTANPDATIASVAANFSASPESQAMYGSTFGPAQINAIYRVLFNRDAEPAGLAYWSQEVAAGRLTPAMAAYGILVGAQNDDATAVSNKLQISTAFYNAQDTSAEIIGYAGDAAATSARTFLGTVTSDAATLTAAQTNLNTAVAAAVSANPAGATFTLTVGQDYADATSAFKNNGLITSDFKFTSANETVTAGAGTLGNTDAIVDGFSTDNDVLNATLTSGAAATTTIQGIETINLTSTIAGSGLDFTNVLGAKNVTLTGTADATLVNVNSNAAPTIAINNYNKVVTLSTVSLAGVTAAGTADALTVKLSGAAAGGTAVAPIIPGLVLDTAASGALEVLNLESAGTSKNTLALSLDAAGAAPTGITKTVVTGGADLDLRVAHSLVTGQTLDGSGHTGALNLVVNRNGAATAATNLTNVTGVDVYTFGDSAAGTDILVASGLADASTVVITESFNGANALSVRGSAASTTNSLTVRLDHVTDATNVAIGTGLTIADVETVNFVAEGGTTTGSSIAGLAVNAGSKVTVDGATKLDLQLATTSKVTTVEVKGAGAHKVDFAGGVTYGEAKNLTIDGSAATGKLTLDGSDFAGTAGGVVESLTIRGGTTDDTITGTANADSKNVIDAGAGVDTVNLATTNNSNVTLGAGADKMNITGVTGVGFITLNDYALGTGGDVLSVDTAAAMTFGGVGAAAVDAQLVVIDAAQADNAAIIALLDAATAETAVIAINNATGVAELWYSATGETATSVKLAAFENITTVGTLTDATAGFTAANFGTWA